MAVIDGEGYRLGIVIVLVNKDNRLFWARRVRQLRHHGWQFPQGGLLENETENDAMYRELHEEIGLGREDVELVSSTNGWLSYRLPPHMVRRDSSPLCIGQKQKWYLLRLIGDESKIQFNATESPEFDAYRWVDYWVPIHHIVPFKRRVYREALKEFEPTLLNQSGPVEKTI